MPSFRKSKKTNEWHLMITVDQKRQYNTNREAAKISTLSSDKTDKYDYVTDEEKLRFFSKSNDRSS